MEIDSTSRIQNAESAASKAERKAAERVTTAEKRVREATKDEEKRVEAVRDQYDKRTVVEKERGDNYLESVRNRSYENLTKLRRDTQSEETRVARKSEKDLRDLNTHYEDSLQTATSRGEAKTLEATKKAYASEQFERKKGEEDVNAIKANYDVEKSRVDSSGKESAAELSKKNHDDLAFLEEKTRTAVEESNEHYQSSYEGALKQNKTALGDLNARAAKDVESLKRDTSLKLSAYADQKSDPFYRMVDLKAEFQENDSGFTLSAVIPPHERDRINVNIRGNEIVLSGKRRSEETLEVSEGRTQRTSAYQSFSESFPLGWPVDPKSMTREWDGDRLVIRIPKRSTYEVPKQKREVAKAALERPYFPKNIPTEKQIIALNSSGESDSGNENATTPTSGKKSGSTLA